MLTAWVFELGAVCVLKKDVSQLRDLVSVDPSNKSAEAKVTNLNLQHFSSGQCEQIQSTMNGSYCETVNLDVGGQ